MTNEIDDKIKRLQQRIDALKVRRNAGLKAERDRLMTRVNQLNAVIGDTPEARIDAVIDAAISKRGGVSAMDVARYVKPPTQAFVRKLAKHARTQREVLHVLSGGKRHVGAIARLTGKKPSNIDTICRNMMRHGLIERVEPATFALAKQASK